MHYGNHYQRRQPNGFAKLEPGWPNEVSPAEAMIAAYDVLSQIFGQKAVIDAYYRTDLDTMAVRDEDDDARSYVS